jgi:hypothetical protein
VLGAAAREALHNVCVCDPWKRKGPGMRGSFSRTTQCLGLRQHEQRLPCPLERMAWPPAAGLAHHATAMCADVCLCGAAHRDGSGGELVGLGVEVLGLPLGMVQGGLQAAALVLLPLQLGLQLHAVGGGAPYLLLLPLQRPLQLCGGRGCGRGFMQIEGPVVWRGPWLVVV